MTGEGGPGQSEIKGEAKQAGTHNRARWGLIYGRTLGVWRSVTSAEARDRGQERRAISSASARITGSCGGREGLLAHDKACMEAAELGEVYWTELRCRSAPSPVAGSS